MPTHKRAKSEQNRTHTLKEIEHDNWQFPDLKFDILEWDVDLPEWNVEVTEWNFELPEWNFELPLWDVEIPEWDVK